MTTKKVEAKKDARGEIDAFAAATKARDAAIKARARAEHAARVVLVSAQALATAQAQAAEYDVEAEKAESEALRHADLARKALEESLGLSPSKEHDKAHGEPEVEEKEVKS